MKELNNVKEEEEFEMSNKIDKELDTCLGHMVLGNEYAERGCGTCPEHDECERRTKTAYSNKFMEEESERYEACGRAAQERTPLDPKWIDECMDMWIGPWLAIMMARDTDRTLQLMNIIRKALIELYEKNDFNTTNEWVVSAYNRMWELLNTFITARLIKLFDEGVSDESRIIVVKRGVDFSI